MTPVNIAATEAKNKFGEVLRRTQLEAQHFIIERDGIPVAAVVPLQDYQRLVAATTAEVENSARRTEAAAALREFLAEVHARMPDVPEEEVEADVNGAINESHNR